MIIIIRIIEKCFAIKSGVNNTDHYHNDNHHHDQYKMLNYMIRGILPIDCITLTLDNLSQQTV